MGGPTQSKLRRQWRNAQARYRTRLREKVEKIHPSKPCRRCHRHVDTELAHTKPTGLKGRGRGTTHRLRDVLKNPDAYVRLCTKCHRGYDSGKHGLELEEAPF